MLRHFVVVCAVLLVPVEASANETIDALVEWTPIMAAGFSMNLLASVLAMLIGTLSGLFLGLGQLSRRSWLCYPSYVATQFFRNAPWLVLLFYAMYVFPFEFQVFGATYTFPAWAKAIVGLSLPVMANFSEIVRGSVQSIPSGQWESADALAFSRMQTMVLVILPQCLKRMLPPWMNLYAVLTTATPLISIVGIQEGLYMTRSALAAEQETTLLMPMYGMLLAMFFLYCYPIATATNWLERKWTTV